MNSVPLLLGLSILSLAFVAMFAGLSFRANPKSIGQLAGIGTAVILSGAGTATSQYALYQTQPDLMSGNSLLVIADIIVGILVVNAFFHVVD